MSQVDEVLNISLYKHLIVYSVKELSHLLVVQKPSLQSTFLAQLKEEHDFL